MKKIFFKSMLLLCALIVGSGTAWGAEGDTHDFAQSLSQLLNNNASISSINISTQSYPVKEVIVTYSYNKSISNAVTVAVSVGSTSWGSKNIPGETSPLSFTNSSESGAIVITFTNNTGNGTGHGTFSVSNVRLVEGASAPAYNITAQSNNSSFGTVSLSGNVITGSPKSGCRYANPAYTVDPENSATVSQDGNAFTVTPSDNTTVTINFEAIPTHSATFSVNEATTSQNFIEGASITFPDDPADINGKTFVGWVTSPIVGSQDSQPSFVTSATMGNADVTYYAVFATEAEDTDIVTDELNQTLTGISGSSYSNFSNKKAASNAVYTGNCAGTSGTIQLRWDVNDNNKKAGIITTASGGKVKVVTVEWNSTTVNGRTLNIYGKNSAYSSYTDLQGDNKGTLLGTIAYGTNTTLNVTGEYTYIGLASASGAMYIDEIDIDWEIEVTTYSAYCTTVSALPVPTITFKDGEDNEITELNANNLNAFIPISVTCSAGDVTLSFESSDDEVAEYDEGNVLTYTEGTTTITATFAGNGSYQGTSATLTVNVERATTTLSFPATPATINIDATATYAATSSPYVSGITYSSNNTSALTVNSETGEITGVAKGSATITASFAGNDNYKPTSKSYTILVVNPNEISYTLTNSQIVSGGPDATSGYGSKAITDGNGKTWNAYAIKNYHSAQTSSNHFLQIRAYNNPTTYYIQVPAYGTRITELQMTVSGSNKSIDGGDNTATLFFSADNTTSATGVGVASGTGSSAVTIDCSALNLNSGYITANGAVRIWDVKVTYEYALTIGSALWTSHVTTDAVDFTGVTAYIAKAVNGETISLKEVTSAPANTPVIIKGDAQKTYYLQTKYESLDDVSSNLLLASDGSVTGDGSSIYALGVGKEGENEGKVGFFLVRNDATIPAGKAYLTYSGTGAPSMLRIEDEAEIITNIEDVEASNKAVKFIENGQLLIKRDNVVYDTMGRIIR